MQIIEMKIEDLIPYENNPRKNDEAVDAVAESIRQFGFKVPIIVDRNKVIVAGHTRLRAAEKLGMRTVPVIMAADLSDDQVKAFRLADNKTAELAAWDFSALEAELEKISDIDMTVFGFELDRAAEWFDRTEKDGAARQEGNDEYNEFLDKFEAKKTTDDCYTPTVVYEAVANWVAEEYGVDRKRFVRPFYPNGDYQSEKYKKDAIVVDNPPFSILSEIINFYTENGIDFFLFAPHLTLFSSSSSSSCALCAGVAITYENGASVNTSFITSLEKGIRLRSCPSLYKAVKEANDIVLKDQHKELPKYEYPYHVITSTRCGQFSRLGIDYIVPIEESFKIRELDAQKEYGKACFGSAYLVSDRLKAEREKAEREKAERWELSERELDIVKSISGKLA